MAGAAVVEGQHHGFFGHLLNHDAIGICIGGGQAVGDGWQREGGEKQGFEDGCHDYMGR